MGGIKNEEIGGAMSSNSCLLDFVCSWIVVPVVQTSFWFSTVLLFDMRRDWVRETRGWRNYIIT